MAITSTTSGVTSGSTTNDSTIALRFTASEAATGFAANDITVSGGSTVVLPQFHQQFTLRPSRLLRRCDTVDVAGNNSIDVGGNNNSAATQSPGPMIMWCQP